MFTFLYYWHIKTVFVYMEVYFYYAILNDTSCLSLISLSLSVQNVEGNKFNE